MLIKFSVANFRSIKEKQTLDMTAIKRVKQHPSHVIENDKNLPNLLTVAAIYGANAAGKSNIIYALIFMQRFVSRSQQNMQKGELIDKAYGFFAPFKFDESYNSAVSEFEILFIQDGVKYQYGFSLNKELVTHEWLYAYPKRAQQCWFERNFDTEKKKYKWYFGSKFKGSQDTIKKRFWQETTRDNGLFLAAAVQNGNVQLAPIFEWFQKKLAWGRVIGRHPFDSAQQCKDDDYKSAILRLVRAADPSIEDIEVEENEIPYEAVKEKLLHIFNEKIIQKTETEKHFGLQIKFKHFNSIEKIDLQDESDGTQKIFNFAASLIEILEQGRIVFIDELNSSLHPQLELELIKIFHDSTVNKNHAQLIFSTHDVSILDREVFRRDQIWFVEKNKENATELYSLAVFKIRPDESLGKGYMKGRYGAIPYFMGGLL